MLTIIYAHPYEGSFNHAILTSVTLSLDRNGIEYNLLDLYADGFDPAVRKEDLARYSEGGTNDALARRYMDSLAKAEKAIFIYPVWWGVEPAIVQGFYDKVFLKDFAWKYSPEGRLLPLLNIGRALIFSTSDAPTAMFKAYFEDYLPEHVFNQIGIFNLSWHNFDGITWRKEKDRLDFLEEAARICLR